MPVSRNQSLAVLVLGSMLLSAIIPVAPLDSEPLAASIMVGGNTGIINLWTVHNQSEGGYDYPNELDGPALGMEFYDTSSLTIGTAIGVDYSWADLADPGIFPADSELYIPLDSYANGGVAWATQVADNAVTNPRIKGGWINDAVSGWESGANMSAIYTALHHEDEHLEAPLLLGLVVYTRDYFVQSPNTWADIDEYLDYIQFWFYPDAFGLLYPNFAGYEDAFHDLRAMLPGLDFWVGIYLHFYSDGEYPKDLFYRQLSYALRWVREGDASCLTVISDFWILNEPESAWLVRNMVDAEYDMEYSSSWAVGTGAVASFAGGTPLADDLISSIEQPIPNNYTFVSEHLQTITVSGMTGSDLRARNLRTGETYDLSAVSGGYAFVAEPREEYQLLNQPLVSVVYSTRQYILTPTSWNNALVRLDTVLNVASTLWINNSIVQVGTYHYQDSMANGTVPQNGIILNQTNDCKLYLRNSVIEPVLRDFPFYFNTSWSGTGTGKVISFQRSVLACYAGYFKPMGYSWFDDSLVYSAMPNGQNVVGFYANFGGSAFQFHIRNTTIWNYGAPQVWGMFLMPCGLHQAAGAFVWDNVTIAGGHSVGLYVDMTFSTQAMELRNTLVYDTSIGDLSHIGTYTRFQIDSGSGTKTVSITTKLSVRSDAVLTSSLLNGDYSEIAAPSLSDGTTSLWELPDVSLEATIIEDNPWPWHLNVSGEDQAHYYMAEALDYWNEDGYTWDYPSHPSFNGSSMAVQIGMSSVGVAEVPRGLFTGLQYLNESALSRQSYHVGAALEYDAVSWAQSTVNLTALQSEANLTVWNTAATTDETAMNLTLSGSGTVSLSGLVAGRAYKTYLDGVFDSLYDGPAFAFSAIAGTYETVVSDSHPYFTTSPVLTVNFAVNYYYDANATDPDGLTLEFNLSTSQPDLVIDNGTGELTGTAPLLNGTFAVSLSASNGWQTVYQNFTLAITNAGAVFSSHPATGMFEREDYEYLPNASDPEGYGLVYNLSTNAPWLILNETGWVVGTPLMGDAGYYYVRISAFDGYSVGWQNFTVHVESLSMPTYQLIWMEIVISMALGFGLLAFAYMRKDSRLLLYSGLCWVFAGVGIYADISIGWSILVLGLGVMLLMEGGLSIAQQKD
jgi:hypothetical protein